MSLVHTEGARLWRRKRKLTHGVRKTIRQAMMQATRDLSIAAVVFAAMALHDEFDFGPSRIERFVVNMLHKFRDWDAGLFEIDDAVEWFESYTKMRINEIMEVDDD